MPTVSIDPELYQRMQSVRRNMLPDALVNEAVRRYLWDLDREKISQETGEYRRQHAQIKAAYLGQYIAMRDAKVVDHDADFAVLRQRVRQRFGRVPVMMILVEEQPATELFRHGFREE
ncbi:MAG: hypothetical protein AB1894_04290 [Chloroflexota bacterium]